MKNSQFDAKTFGVGQLITQRKLFRVPAHQRSYAWETEAVRSFLSDIEAAHAERDSDYFIGLVVLLGPEQGEWILLDGQQRLTTSSLIFSAIRYWLAVNDFPADAQQVDHEYLGVRRLGGDYSSRMQLNEENQDSFLAAVIQLNSTEDLKAIIKESGKKSSNRLLLEAAISCREWVDEIAKKSSAPDRSLFDLVNYLDGRVKVVCVDVSSEVDAYILFESLNDRGIELSAMDLIKNHIVSQNSALEKKWSELVEAIGDTSPDKFLKVFWTSRYGIAQKTQIFRRVKETYGDSLSVARLMNELIDDAEHLSALDDDEHPLWSNYSSSVRDLIFLVRQLGTRQARPVVLAAIRGLPSSELERFLWLLIVGVVRFQVIGKGRTGVIEKVFGRLCQSLSRGDFHIADDSLEVLDELFIPEDQFIANFQVHADSRYARIAYVLAQIAVFKRNSSQPAWLLAGDVRELIERATLTAILSPNGGCWSPDSPALRQIGNFMLMDDGQDVVSNTSSLILEPEDIEVRSAELAAVANNVWKA